MECPVHGIAASALPPRKDGDVDRGIASHSLAIPLVAFGLRPRLKTPERTSAVPPRKDGSRNMGYKI